MARHKDNLRLRKAYRKDRTQTHDRFSLYTGVRIKYNRKKTAGAALYGRGSFIRILSDSVI